MLSESVFGNDPEQQLRHACAELKRRLQSGEDCRAEHFLDAYPSLASSVDHALELIYAEFVARQELGQQPDPAEWLARFPQWREELARRFQILREVYDNQPADPATVPQSDATAAPTPPPRAGRLKTFARYELLERLGQGGMGVVFKARDTVLGRTVALKVMRAGVFATPQDIQRFYNEARTAAQIDHPHVIKLHEIGEEEDQHYFTMAYAPGGSLADHRERFTNEPKAAAALVEKIARAVHCLHTKEILHRDLKPGNVLLDGKGEPLVSDFGLAKFLGADAELTQTGAIIGTPAYMSPEQAVGLKGPLTPRSDIWSLGVILYELLAGQKPFARQGLKGMSQQIIMTDPLRPRKLQPNLDRTLEAIVLKCLEKEPIRRYVSVEALADDLGNWHRGQPTVAQPAGWGHRAWRSVRRHNLAALFVVLLSCLAVAMSVITHFTDPNRVLKDLQSQLATGEKVTLLGEVGPPRHFQVKAGEETTSTSRSNDKAFSVSTLETALVEIMPDPMVTSYFFRVRVRHDDGTIGSRVGIYVAQRSYVTPKGIERCFCEIGFDDQQARTGMVNRDAQGRKISQVIFRVWRYREGEQLTLCKMTRTCVPAIEFTPAGPAIGPGIFRELAVKVTADKMQAYWQGQIVGEMTFAYMKYAVQEMFKDHADPCNLIAEVSPRDGLGLIVSQGAASFQSASIEPLLNDK